jgi:hypothetical protein
MKTKRYEFTAEEILVLRDALVEYYQQIKGLTPGSPIAIRAKALAVALKDQFKQDAVVLKDQFKQDAALNH